MKKEKTLSIFVASSNELYHDRMVLGDIIRELDDQYEAEHNIRIKLQKWEDLPSYYTWERTQASYNHKIQTSQIFVMLLNRHFGQYTKEEFEVAKTSGKEILYFLKQTDGLNQEHIKSEPTLNGYKPIEYTDPLQIKQALAQHVASAIQSGKLCECHTHSGNYQHLQIAIHRDRCDHFAVDDVCLKDTIRSLNDIYEKHGLRIKLSHVDNPNKDIFISLIDGCNKSCNIPQEVQQRIDSEVEMYNKSKKPHIYMYVKAFNKAIVDFIGQQYTHYPHVYESIDSLKLHVILQLQQSHLNSIRQPQIQITDVLYLNNQPMINLSDVDFIKKNPQIKELLDQAHSIKAELANTDNADTQQKYDEVHATISTIIPQIINILNTIIKCQNDNNSEDVQMLYTMLLEGNYKRAEEHLSRKLSEQGRVIDEYDNHYNNFKQFFRYYDVYRDLIMLNTGNEEGYKLACLKYEEEIKVTKKRLRSDDTVALYREYADFLRSRKDEKCIKYYNMSIKHLDFAQENEDISQDDYGRMMIECLHEKGAYYWGEKELTEAQHCIESALSFVDESIDESKYKIAVASLYDDYGLLRVEQLTDYNNSAAASERCKQIEETIDAMYFKALKCYPAIELLDAEGQDGIASIYSNIGRAYWHMYRLENNNNWFEQAYANLRTSIDIRNDLQYSMPAKYEPRLVFPINNMGELYSSRGIHNRSNEDFATAMEYFVDAKVRLERHVSYNIHYYGARLAGVEARIARTFAYMGDAARADTHLKMAEQSMYKYTGGNSEKYKYRLEEFAQIQQEIYNLKA